MKKNKIIINSKLFILLMIFFGIKLFFSCHTSCNDMDIEMTYNRIDVYGYDNSGFFYQQSNKQSDTAYSESLAINLSLTDTLALNFTASHFQKLKEAFSFQQLKALDCHQTYIVKHKVTDLSVFTIFNINDTVNAGDDISKYILFSLNEYKLYNNIKDGIHSLNGNLSNYPSTTKKLILKTSVNNVKAQFKVIITLDNGQELIDTTQIITIKKS